MPPFFEHSISFNLAVNYIKSIFKGDWKLTRFLRGSYQRFKFGWRKKARTRIRLNTRTYLLNACILTLSDPYIAFFYGDCKFNKFLRGSYQIFIPSWRKKIVSGIVPKLALWYTFSLKANYNISWSEIFIFSHNKVTVNLLNFFDFYVIVSYPAEKKSDPDPS